MNIFGHPVRPRVGQLDASLLDAELFDQLKTRLWDAFKIYRPELKDRYEHELKALLRLLLFKVTIWDNSTTYGGKLQNLKLVHARSTASHQIPLSKKQKALYGLLTIGGGYLWAKLSEYMIAAAYDSGDEPRVVRLRQFVDKVSTIWTAASLFNFIAFVYSGEYSTLILRLLRMRYVSLTRTVSRVANFEFQNRQLVWNALTEFLLFVAPLVNVAKIQRKIAAAFFYKPGKAGDLGFLPEKTCAICYQKDAGLTKASPSSNTITNPYLTNCKHAYCYVCIKLKLQEGEGWTCLRCGDKVQTAVPLPPVSAIK